MVKMIEYEIKIKMETNFNRSNNKITCFYPFYTVQIQDLCAIHLNIKLIDAFKLVDSL